MTRYRSSHKDPLADLQRQIDELSTKYDKLKSLQRGSSSAFGNLFDPLSVLSAGLLPANKLVSYPNNIAKHLAGDGSWVGGFDLIYNQQRTSTGPLDTGTNGVNQSYKHLLVIAGARTVISGTLGPRFNNDSGTNYDIQLVSANAASLTASGQTGQTHSSLFTATVNSAPADSFAVNMMLISNYASDVHKSFIGFSYQRRNAISAAGLFFQLGSGTWLSTSAINRIALVTDVVAKSNLYIFGCG